MFALPPRQEIRDGLRPTGVACPDCGGVLGVVRDGYGSHPSFCCRVGHRFALVTLLTSKEERLEERLWSALVAVEELIALLRDIDGDPALARGLGVGSRWRERMGRGHQLAAHLRELIETDEPVDLSDGPPGS